MYYQKIHMDAEHGGGWFGRFKGILFGCLFFLCAVFLFTATFGLTAFADEEKAYGRIKADYQAGQTYMLTVKNTNSGASQQTTFDGSLDEQLPAGTYTVSCEENNGKTLIFKNNTFTVKSGETTKLEVTEGDAAKIYVRPTLFDGFGGTISLTLKSTDSFGQEYSFTVPRYSYDYAEWSDNYYWADFALPEGTYEITRYQVCDNGVYYRTYVDEKTLKAVGSWSAILYSTSSSQQISAEEAASVYLMDELPQETEAVETEAAEQTDNTQDEEGGVSVLLILVLILGTLVLTVAIFILARKVVIGSERKH